MSLHPVAHSLSVLPSVNSDTTGEIGMATIILKKEVTGWCAQFVNDTQVIAAFGTDTIPTAFTSSAPFEMVEREIKKLNPHHNVIGETDAIAN